MLSVCLLMFFPHLSWAGTCPVGANYLSTTNPTGPLVTLSSLGITSCYYIAANGSDSNDGASEASGHPWAHAPGMPSCSGNCASNKPSGGAGYIFRGGDTWHFGNSSATPYTGGTWLWTSAGSSMTSPIYIGVDPAWYSGSSWARPILTGDNPTSTSSVASCSYNSSDMVYLSSFSYGFFDNFELTGQCWNTSSGASYIHYTGAVAGNNNPTYIENNYVHGWTHTTAGTQAGGTGFQGYNQNYGETWRFNVIDGSDSDYHALQPWGQGSDGWDLEYNVTRYAGGTSVFDDCHIQHDNLFEYISNVTDNSTHTDVDFCYGEYSGGSSNPNLFYNNIFRYIGTIDSATVSYNFTLDTPSGQTDYVFNNVFHDFYGGTGYNYNALCDGGGCGPTTMWNNTAEGALPNYGWVWANGGTSVSVTSTNNHWIVAGTGASASFTGPSLVTESSPVYQTITTANGQGYTSANNFAPTAATNATVTASGTNETASYCADSVLHNAVAEIACIAGTTNGCTYNTSSHSLSCPAITPTARPSSGSWNVGAYQNQGLTLASPTNLTGSTSNGN
jgi:hypothetical protein